MKNFSERTLAPKDLGMQNPEVFRHDDPDDHVRSELCDRCVILALGGHFIITGTMTLGNFTAFNSYLALLIFPILVIGFMSNVIAQAQASYERVQVVLMRRMPKRGRLKEKLRGDIEGKE